MLPLLLQAGKRKMSSICMLQVLSSILPQECYVLLGNFNDRVGSRSREDERWDKRSPHGRGVLNDTGRELLSFFNVNRATVCNTWFQKEIYKQTWQHPKSKQWHCIDYAIMRKVQCWRCLNVSVKAILTTGCCG